MCLKALLNLAHLEGVLPSPPRIDMLPQDDSKPVVPPSEAEYHAVLEACEKFRAVAPLLPEVVEFIALTGLRRGEVFNLRWSSVELDRQVLRVESNRRGRRINGQAWRPKHGKWREVPLEPAAFDLLHRVRELVPHDSDDQVFPNRGGAPYARMDRAPEAAGKGYFPDAVAAANGSGGQIHIGIEDGATEPRSDQRVAASLLDRVRKRVGELTHWTEFVHQKRITLFAACIRRFHR